MRTLGAMLRALLRQVRSPGLVVATWCALLALAALAVQIDLGSAPALYSLVSGALTKDGLPLVDETLHATRSGLGAGTALATLLALALFSLAGAGLALVSAGRERSALRALRATARVAPRLLLVTLCGVVWLALASLAARALIDPASAWVASRWGLSEWRCHVGAELAGLALLAPGIVAADLARVRIVLADARGFLAPFAGALCRVLTSVAPWIALLAAAALESFLLEWLVARQSIWIGHDTPRWALETLPLLFVFARVLIYALYLGGLASTLDSEGH